MGESRYFDDDKGREGFAPLDRCYRSRVCALFAGHGGGCDPRCERARVKALHRILRGVPSDAILATVPYLVGAEGANALRMAEALLGDLSRDVEGEPLSTHSYYEGRVREDDDDAAADALADRADEVREQDLEDGGS
jgi:hypothetical protein